MRIPAARLLDAAAWAVILLLAGAAVVMVAWLGFAGLILLGAATCMVCARAALNDDVPTWGEAVFRAQLGAGRTQPPNSSMRPGLRFYGGCGLFLLAVGLVGLIRQVWFTAGS